MAEALVPGSFVTPSLQLARKLGEGGMGSVWVALHLGLRTEVVVKFISAYGMDSAEAVSRFEREAALAALAKGPNVVQLFDYGITPGGLPYITMELLEGEDLGRRIARDGAVAPSVLSGWLTQACRGLARAHAKGIVHRDIKPENIFLCTNDDETVVKVLDFGIAKGALSAGEGAASLTSALLGTPCYMSPEQMTFACDIDHRSDLWALGVLAYYALTGVRPFNQSSLAALVDSVTKLPIPPPSHHRPELSVALDAWMSKALKRAPNERFASALDMAAAFAEATALAGAGDSALAAAHVANTAVRSSEPATTHGEWVSRDAGLLPTPGLQRGRSPRGGWRMGAGIAGLTLLFAAAALTKVHRVPLPAVPQGAIVRPSEPPGGLASAPASGVLASTSGPSARQWAPPPAEPSARVAGHPRVSESRAAANRRSAPSTSASAVHPSPVGPPPESSATAVPGPVPTPIRDPMNMPLQ